MTFLDTAEMMMLSMIDFRQKGFLTKPDFRKFFERNGFEQTRSDKIFDLLDIDQDGRVTYNQFLEIIRNRRIIS